MSYLTAKRRPEFRLDDVKDDSRLVRVLTESFRDVCLRLEALEEAKGVVTLDELSFNTGSTLTPTVAPFANGNLRVACPYTPTGVILLFIEQVNPPGQPVSTTARDVKWRFASGDQSGSGAIIVDFVTGLSANTAYKMRLGVTRG